MEQVPSPRVSEYPVYSRVGEFLRLMDGHSDKTLKIMRQTIWEHSGTPQATVDWSDPETWIQHTLAGDEQELALYLWHESNKLLTPRSIDRESYFCKAYDLITPDRAGFLHITEAGQAFLAGTSIRQIDYTEGLVHLLAIVAENGPATRVTLIPPYAEFLQRYTDLRSQNAIESCWYSRIVNLIDRGLIQRTGNQYQITPEGLAYIQEVGMHVRTSGGEIKSQPLAEIRTLLVQQDKEVRDQIRQALVEIDPYNFEKLIKRLLEAMGYQNVEVTAKSGDGGVDVKAEIEVGITSVREVVQVKRHHANIQRPVLDQLRGSLYRFSAQRGTIITSGSFSKGAVEAAFEHGAPPITLIDGDRLIQLLIDNGIGADSEEIRVLKFNPQAFQFGTEVANG